MNMNGKLRFSIGVPSRKAIVLLALSLLSFPGYGGPITNRPKNQKAAKSLPRGEYGFTLGATLAQVDANASKRGLERVVRWNDSIRLEQGRYFRVHGDAEIESITMFLEEGPLNEIGIHYKTKDHPKMFEMVRERLRKKLGKETDFEDAVIDIPAGPANSAEHRHNQSAYWSDCRTLIQLDSTNADSLELRFSDLKPNSAINIGIIGRSGHEHSFSGCETTDGSKGDKPHTVPLSERGDR